MSCVKVQITNTYADRDNTVIVEVAVPREWPDLEDWWEDVVYPETGDGNGGDAYTEAEVLECDTFPALVGEKWDWCG